MDFPQTRYEVFIIKEGSCVEKNGELHGSAGITLILGPHVMVVGTGLPQDRQCILNGLSDKQISADSVDYVVCPYGHVETTGNLNLFPGATHIVGYSIMQGERHLQHDFMQDIPYEVDADVEVVSTPGLFPEVVSVVCRGTPLGVVAVAPGAFHSQDDLDTPELWVDASQDADTQQQGRIELLKEAHYIVPRYGPLYKVPDCYKGSTVGMVITP